MAKGRGYVVGRQVRCMSAQRDGSRGGDLARRPASAASRRDLERLVGALDVLLVLLQDDLNLRAWCQHER